MPVTLYIDMHVNRAITTQLKRRGVDVLTAQDDKADQLDDEQLYGRAEGLGRLLFTQDIDFLQMAENWQRQGRPFSGLLFAHQLRATVGRLVHDLELIAKASDPSDWINKVEYLPYPIP